MQTEKGAERGSGDGGSRCGKGRCGEGGFVGGQSGRGAAFYWHGSKASSAISDLAAVSAGQDAVEYDNTIH